MGGRRIRAIVSPGRDGMKYLGLPPSWRKAELYLSSGSAAPLLFRAVGTRLGGRKAGGRVGRWLTRLASQLTGLMAHATLTSRVCGTRGCERRFAPPGLN